MLEETDKQNNINKMLEDFSEDQITIESPCTPGRMIRFTKKIFHGEDILEQTYVYNENPRQQDFLNEHSLARLTASIQLVGQSEPAKARRTEQGCEIVDGSCRRMATFLAKKPYIVVEADDLTDDEAKALTYAQNISEKISLIERGYKWEMYVNQGMTLRQIASEIENDEVSHTLVGIGVNGARINKGILLLYPSLNSIGNPSIQKLHKALNSDTAPKPQDIIEFVQGQHQDVIALLRTQHATGQDVNCGKLTKIIVSYCTAANDSNCSAGTPGWPEHVTVKTNAKGRVTNVKFDVPLAEDKATLLQDFLNGLYE